jgi:methylated-DNA-[protein]-cysteine S-methyltransferase
MAGDMMRKKSQKPTQEWRVNLLETPVGPLCLYFTDRGLSALEFAGAATSLGPIPEAPPARLKPYIDTAKKALAAYFAGAPTDFADLTLDPQGTPFQRRVWAELQRIPRGQAISYKELAQRVGNPKASRAVGQANGANPIPLIIPCHRVVAANGSLGGYSSGLDRKRWLLHHEGVM